MLKISILVPMYNVEKFISRCAESLFHQDYENMEFVFVNDCTPDGSERILRSLLEQYPNRKEQVKIVRHKKNRGLVVARKTALANAVGDFVMWVDGDDWIEQGCVKALVEKQLDTDSDIVVGSAWKVRKSGKEVLFTPEYQTREAMLEEILKPDSHLCVWSKIIRRSLYEQFDIITKEGCDYCEDWWVTPQLAYYTTKVASIPTFVYNYNRTNETSMVELCHGQLKVEYWKQSIESCSFLVNFFRDKEPRWNEAAHKKGVKHVYSYLRYAAKYSEPIFFSELVRQMYEEYKEYYSVIGWNHLLKRSFESHYGTMSAYMKTRSFVWHKMVKPLWPKNTNEKNDDD